MKLDNGGFGGGLGAFDIRTVAEVMVAHAEDSLHLWLNATLIAGAGLVVLGAIAAGVGGLRRRSE